MAMVQVDDCASKDEDFVKNLAMCLHEAFMQVRSVQPFVTKVDNLVLLSKDPVTGWDSMCADSIALNGDILDMVFDRFPVRVPPWKTVHAAWTMMAGSLSVYSCQWDFKVPRHKVKRVIRDDAEAFYDLWRKMIELIDRAPTSKNVPINRLKRTLLRGGFVRQPNPAKAIHALK